MIAHRTDEWYRARLGKFTASSFAYLMSKPADKTAKISKTALNCIEKSAAELYYNDYNSRPDSDATRWGLNYESMAIEELSKTLNMETLDMGFVEHPLIKSVGATPDTRIIDPTKLDHFIIAQIKCPYNQENHFKYIKKIFDTNSLRKSKSAYFWQMQGEMWVTGAIHSYFVSFDPRLLNDEDSLHIVKINRDEEAIKLLETAIINAIFLRNEMLEDFNNGTRKPRPLYDYH